MIAGVEFNSTARRGSTGILFGGGGEPSSWADVICPKHAAERVTSVCQHRLCGKTMCRSCQEEHADPQHRKELLPVAEFARRASAELEQGIRAVKEVKSWLMQHKSKLEAEARACRQSIMTFVEQFFAQLQTETEKTTEKIVCQLETRYLSIKRGQAKAFNQHLSRGLSYQLPKLEVDPSMICLDTLLKRMVYLKKDVTQLVVGEVINRPTGLTGTHFSSGGAVGATGAGVITTATNSIPMLIVTSPPEDSPAIDASRKTPTSNNTFFGFPQTAYKTNPPKLDERRNFSLSREVRNTSTKNGMIPDRLRSSEVKDPLLYTSKMYSARGQKTLERPSLPTQPFAQILGTTDFEARAALKEYVPTPNIDKPLSQKTFSATEIQEILKKTAHTSKKDNPHEISGASFVESRVEREKENKDFLFRPTHQYFKVGEVASPTSAGRAEHKFDHSRPSTFTELPSPHSLTDLDKGPGEYRAHTFTELPCYEKPSTSTYEYKYRRQQYTTGSAVPYIP